MVLFEHDGEYGGGPGPQGVTHTDQTKLVAPILPVPVPGFGQEALAFQFLVNVRGCVNHALQLKERRSG